MKKVVFSAALMLGLSAAVFAGAPKGEAKDAKPATTETATKTTSGTTYYWYQVSYATNPNGSIPAGATVYAQQDESTVESPCELGSDHDCIRGFLTPLTGASASPGDARIKTDDPK